MIKLIVVLIFLYTVNTNAECSSGKCCGACKHFCKDGERGENGISPNVSQITNTSCISITSASNESYVLCNGSEGPQGEPGIRGPEGPSCDMGPLYLLSSTMSIQDDGIIYAQARTCPQGYYNTWVGLKYVIPNDAVLMAYCQAAITPQEVPTCFCANTGETSVQFQFLTICVRSSCVL